MKRSIYILGLFGLLISSTSFAFDMSSPADSLVVDTTGNVGVGIAVPQSKLDVDGDIKARFSGSSTSGLQQLFKMSVNNTNLTSKSDAGFVLENAREGFSWAFRTDENNGGFSASKQFTGAREFELINTTAVAANVELHLSNGGKNIGGQWLNASSRSYKENINELSSEDAMQALKGLKSVTYQLKRDVNKEQRVGFIAEDVPALLATKDKKTVDSLQIIAVLTKALQEQNKSLLVQDKSLQQQAKSLLDIKTKMKAKDERIDNMEEKISKLVLMQERMAQMLETSLSPVVFETSKANQHNTSLSQ